MVSDLVERHDLALGFRCVVGDNPAEEHRASAMTTAVEPVHNARIPMSDYGPKSAVLVALCLEAIDTRMAVAVVERLPPEVTEMDAPIEGIGRLHVDDECLIGA